MSNGQVSGKILRSEEANIFELRWPGLGRVPLRQKTPQNITPEKTKALSEPNVVRILFWQLASSESACRKCDYLALQRLGAAGIYIPWFFDHLAPSLPCSIAGCHELQIRAGCHCTLVTARASCFSCWQPLGSNQRTDATDRTFSDRSRTCPWLHYEPVRSMGTGMPESSSFDTVTRPPRGWGLQWGRDEARSISVHP